MILEPEGRILLKNGRGPRGSLGAPAPILTFAGLRVS